MTSIARPCLALSIALLAACGREASSAPAFTARDSSGIHIVEYAETPQGSQSITLGDAPLFRVGDDPGERELSFVVLGALLPDGGAVIVDGTRSQEVVRINPNGSLGAVLAHAGQGPGEVASVGSLVSLGGDTVLIQDNRNAQIIILAGDHLVKMVSTAADPGLARTSRVATKSGEAILMTVEDYRGQPVNGWIPGRFVRLFPWAQAIDTIGSYDMADPAGVTAKPQTAFTHFGKVVGSGAWFVGSRSDLPQLTWWGSNGKLRQVVRWKADRTYPTEADLDAWLDSAVRPEIELKGAGLMTPAQVDEILAQQRAGMRVDPSVPFPLFLRVQGDGKGGVWISEYSHRAGAFDPIRRWSVVSLSGEWLGTVTLPENFRLLDVRGDRVLGVLSDSRGVQSVAVYEVKETPAAP